MLERRPLNRLQLGPIVGHTDHQSTRIWIRVFDDPSLYGLRIQGAGVFPFQQTTSPEFGTAIAIAQNLRSDWQYRYQVLRQNRVVPGSSGSFRTMPLPGSMAEFVFAVVSCSAQDDLGAWPQLREFIERAKPRFLLMIGDQVYMDDATNRVPNIFGQDLTSRRGIPRERLMAEKYQENWSRDVVRHILANIPTYMMWDDHDIRDGWGSFAADSPTLAGRYPRGKPIYERYNAYFESARKVYWNFQRCLYPPTGVSTLVDPPAPEANPFEPLPGGGVRRATPFVFRCGRTVVLITDSRGERDVWREQDPILGSDQWQFIQEVIDSLDSKDEALMVVTTAPIVANSSDGMMQSMLGGRTDDVDLFKEGDAQGLLQLMGVEPLEDWLKKALNTVRDPGGAGMAGGAVIAGIAQRYAGISMNLGGFKLNDIDDVRDQWSHHFSRPEQERLIRKAAEARLSNRPHSQPRGLLFVGGDLHAGGLFDISVEDPEFKATCLISSGISKKADNEIDKPTINTLVDENFEVASGIEATMRNIVTDYNFGVVQVIPTGATPVIIPDVVHSGSSGAWGFFSGYYRPEREL